MLRTKAVSFTILFLVFLLTSSNLHADTWPLVLSGEPAPGIDGARFSGGISQAAMNASGTMAFHAGIVVNGVQGYGIFRIVDGRLSPVVLSGQSVPDAPGWSFGALFSQPDINSAGEILFSASLSGGTQPTYSHFAIFVVSGNGFRRVADTETPAPGQPAGWRFARFSNVSMNDAGDVAFCGTVAPPSGYSGSLPSGDVFLMSKSGLRSLMSGCPEYSLNSKGELAFITTEAVSVLSNGVVRIVAQKGQPVPNSNVILDSMHYPSMNDAGDVAFVNGQVACARVCNWFSNALVRTESGVLRKIAAGGDPVPGVPGGVFDTAFLSPQMSDEAMLFTSRMYIKEAGRPNIGPIGLIGRVHRGMTSIVAKEDDFLPGIGTLDFIGTPTFGDPQASLVAFVANAGSGAATGIYTATANQFKLLFPQMANGAGTGGQWRTSFVLANRSSSPALATITVYNDDGTAQTPVSVNIPAFGVTQYQTDGSGALRAGWATAESDQALSGISIFSLYNESGDFVGEVGAAASVPLRAMSLFAQSGAGTSTGVALANPNTTDVDITLVLKDSNSTELARTSMTLRSMGHIAKYVNELFPGITGALDGKIDITSTQPLVAITLRQRNATFTSLPVIP